MSLALPAAAPPPPRRQLLVGTALVVAAGTMLVGSMIATWMMMRAEAVAAGERFPGSYEISEVQTNVMLITILSLCVFAQWAVFAAARGDRLNTGIALGVTAVLAVAFINAQAFVYVDMEIPIADGGYAVMFYSLTGTILALVIAGLVFTAVAAFRFLGGHISESELVSAHALYWYFVAAAFAAVWFFVYVTK